jgi:hypothetical protein
MERRHALEETQEGGGALIGPFFGDKMPAIEDRTSHIV